MEIRTLGSLAVLSGGAEVALPPSRKTRALLAYLAVVARPQRRERLCEMFWDVPDDPRGSLRWSLSKLRQIAGDAVETSRDAVAVRGDGFVLDYARLRAATAGDVDALATDELEAVAGLVRGPFLEGLSLPRCPDYEAWRTAIANEVELLHLRLLRLLVDRLAAADPERALVHANRLRALDPEDTGLGVEIDGLMAASRRRAVVAQPSERPSERAAPTQEIRYCKSPDGVRIAYAVAGEGYPILKCANWLSHLEFEWESPVWRHWMRALTASNRLVRYDMRGNGLSDWDVPDHKPSALLADLEGVADAAGLERFALLGISGGCATSVAYAARHPERVSHLILYGGRVKGWRVRADAAELARRRAIIALMRSDWGGDNPAFHRMFTSLFVPEASPEQMEWFTDLQRRTVSPEGAARIQEASADSDCEHLLALVRAPTLVLHAIGDAAVPFAAGRAYAAGIPGARFVPLDSRNHILLEDEPAFARFFAELGHFVAS